MFKNYLKYPLVNIQNIKTLEMLNYVSTFPIPNIQIKSILC